MEGDSTNREGAPLGDSGSSSLTLSLTPPLSETSTISEHLSSVENDRSLPELLVNFPPDERISLEPKPPSLSDSYTSSFVSLNGLERFISTNMEGRTHAQSILEEILSNDQFKSDSDESLNIFANVDLDDKLLNSYNAGKSVNFDLNDEVCKRVKDFEDLIAVKNTTIAALTSELDSFRELLSNTSSLGTTTTEYKQFQEECHNKLVEYRDAIVHRDEQIEKLTSSLQQAILNREEMKQHFRSEIAQLQEQLEKTSNLLKDHKKSFDFDEICAQFEHSLGPPQLAPFGELKAAFASYVEMSKRALENEISNLKTKFSSDKAQCESEIKSELDAKHSKEMEELRTYFEKKCADLEKNYSEEVFSQQSRKMSESSSCSELSSDFVGPGGDTRVDYTRKDLVKLRQSLVQLIKIFDGFNLEDLSDSDFERLTSEIGKFEFRNLLKFDLSLMKSELQNKYHAELEILREDYDNRVDELNVEHEKKLKSLNEEIDDLNRQLRGRIVTTSQQEVANSGEFEIDEVVQSYERRLQEQVTLAKIDIIAALELQIQRLVASDSLDDDWPEELLQLKSRFADKYQTEIAALKQQHSEEIARLKDEHLKNLNAALERARRRSLRDADSLSKGELELLKERDLLKKQTLALRNLLGELIKYFTQCEDELNNTLVEELMTKNFTQIERELDSLENTSGVKRVHLTPNFTELIDLIDNSPDKDLETIDLKSELGSCLEKLKADANAILQLSTSFAKSEELEVPKRKNESLELTRKLINETQIKNELVDQLSEARSIIHSLETDRGALENQLEQLIERQKNLECDLLTARDKIAELIENGHKEIVSEGYGENGDRGVRGLAEAVAALSVLQDEARVLVENRSQVDQNVVKLVEGLARAGDKIVEEARREREDLKQQIEAADKKYKITCQFLEDQAAEREQERDDAQKQIDSLKDHLRDREKDRATYERYTTEVEHLEQQLRDMSKLVEVGEKKVKEVEGERQEAVEKIYELRDIIRDLEEQVRVKTSTEEELRSIVSELEIIVKQQVTDEKKDVSENTKEFHQYVGDLENEVQRLRLTSEIAGSEGALKQIKNQLSDFETTLDKRTKDLEGFHSTVSTTCSSPSEDMSIQERSIYDECEIPLQQLARLKEKLLRHSRAEDAALKRIRDLEMQIVALKNDLEESQTEREILRKQISDHLVLISNLQIRLDEQRIRAEHIEKQTNTSLEVQNYDLKNTIASLEEKIAKRDKTIAQLKSNIDETKKRLEEREKEDDLVVQMQEQVEFLRSENAKLKEESKLLNLDEKEVESLNRLLLSGVSIHDLENFEQCRRQMTDSFPISPIPGRKNHETTFLSLPNKANSTEKHVRFEDDQLKQLEGKIELLQTHLDETEENLKKATQLFEEEQKKSEEQIKLLEAKNGEIEANFRKLLQEEKTKSEEIQARLDQANDEMKKSKELEANLRLQNEEIQARLDQGTEEMKKSEAQLQECSRRLESRDKEVKTLYKVNNELKNSVKIKEEEIAEIPLLRKRNEEVGEELRHLQHLLLEKEKIIEHMEADSKSLHTNLETIQNKLQETGNVVDLSRRLRDEQKKNAELFEELHTLKAQLLSVDKKSLEDITSQIERELNYSAYLDANLLNAVGEGSLESEDVDGLKLLLKKQKSVNKQLVKAREAVETKFELLEQKYENLKKELERVQLEDAVLIGQLRTKLTQTMDVEDEALRDLRESKKYELGVKNEKIIELESQISAFEHNERLLRADLEAKVNELGACKVLQEQSKAEIRKLKRLLSEHKAKSSDLVPDQIMEKIKELNAVARDNKQMIDLIARLNNEKLVLEERIVALEEHHNYLPFDDPSERANYLFAKYLRSESYRKALVWQKKYLISLIEMVYVTPVEHSIVPKRAKFKHVGIMVVSICRMKYLVKRWHSGKRIVRRKSRETVNFQVGQPVSSQNFVPSALNQPKTDMPWVGTSPPTKEPQVLRFQRIATRDALSSPGLLSKYVERFNQIQDKLGLDTQ
ncbi:pericentrin isoform X2 [Tribolium castaneum]|uniref:pericentrin isoform X2 n=1 Tax=Tribolium castaneum TaxID=7070 RepID=UPI0030FE004B